MNNTESLSQQASRGAFWSLTSNITISAISFVGTAILARMLEPKDFGLIGMAILVTGIVQLFGNFGLGAALVQKKNVTNEELSTVFWANCAVGLVLMLICILFSPLACIFFREKEVQWILLCLAFNFVLSALSTVHNTILYKNVQMKPIAFIEIGSRCLRVGSMLIAAFCGMTFWSIVIGMIVERFFKTVSFWFLNEWRPAPIFSVHKFQEMFKFGRNILGSGFLNYLNQNIDFIFTGRVLGADFLGFYQMAFNVPHLIHVYVNDSVGSLSFPFFCKIQDDNERLIKGFLKIIKFISIGTFPILVGLSFVAHDFISVIYGERWLLAVAPLKILCFCAGLASVNSIVGGFFYSKGRPDLVFKWGCVRLPTSLFAIFIGARLGGIIGVAWGMLIVEVLSLVMIWQVFRVLNRNLKDYLMALLPAVAASMTMVIVLVVVNSLPIIIEVNSLLRLLIDFLLGSVTYVLVIFLGFNNVFKEVQCFFVQTFIASK